MIPLFSELVKAAKKKGSHGDDIAKSMEVQLHAWTDELVTFILFLDTVYIEQYMDGRNVDAMFPKFYQSALRR